MPEHRVPVGVHAVELFDAELLLELEALELAPLAPEPLVAEELLEPAALTPELIVEPGCGYALPGRAAVQFGR